MSRSFQTVAFSFILAGFINADAQTLFPRIRFESRLWS